MRFQAVEGSEFRTKGRGTNQNLVAEGIERREVRANDIQAPDPGIVAVYDSGGSVSAKI